MTTDIFVVSYWKDANWLEYCLRSIQKYAKGFRQTVVVYPARDIETMKPVCDKFNFVVQKTVEEPEGKGHEFQNALKTMCDTFSDADYFFHLDSDCVLTEEASPEDYFTNGLPDIVYAHFSALDTAHNGGPVPWQRITTRALGVYVEIETMRRFPLLYPRWLYEKTRARVEEVNHMDFQKYALYSPPLPPAWRGYSEFCTLGAMAYYFFRDRFYFYDTANPLKPGKVKQGWSHSGLTEEERLHLEKVTR
jgi:hypothetical protein